MLSLLISKNISYDFMIANSWLLTLPFCPSLMIAAYFKQGFVQVLSTSPKGFPNVAQCLNGTRVFIY